MSKTATARTLELEPIDRLEEKITLLVSLVAQLRTEQAQATAENARLTGELEALTARLADSEGTAVELTALREERDIIRTRVGEMLQQLEQLSV